jgi:hypothetical protein
MPAITIILNVVLCASIVLAIVGLCAWGVVTDRPFAARLTSRAHARSQQLPDRRRTAGRRRSPRAGSGHRGPLRRALDLGA